MKQGEVQTRWGRLTAPRIVGADAPSCAPAASEVLYYTQEPAGTGGHVGNPREESEQNIYGHPLVYPHRE